MECLQEISMNGDHLTIMHTGRCQDCNANGEQPKSASVKTPDALCKACNDTHYVTRFLKPDQKIGECGLGLGNRSDDADNSAVLHVGLQSYVPAPRAEQPPSPRQTPARQPEQPVPDS